MAKTPRRYRQTFSILYPGEPIPRVIKSTTTIDVLRQTSYPESQGFTVTVITSAEGYGLTQQARGRKANLVTKPKRVGKTRPERLWKK